MTYHLILHGVGEPPHPLEPGERRVWMSTAALRSLLDTVVGRPELRLTFDDGNASDHAIVLAELVARGLTATFFVPAARVGKPGFLTQEALHDLVVHGMRVQSHGMNHVIWRGLDAVALDEELVQARALLERLSGQPVDEVAIPFCLYDRRVLRRLRASGYHRVYTCDRGPADPRAWLQPRTEMTEAGPTVDELTNPSRRLRLEIALKQRVKRWR